MICSVTAVMSPSPQRLGGAGAGGATSRKLNSTLGISHGRPNPELDCPCMPIATVPTDELGIVSCATTAERDGPLLGSVQKTAPSLTESAAVSVHSSNAIPTVLSRFEPSPSVIPTVSQESN